jgi:hypothetical protein
VRSDSVKPQHKEAQRIAALPKPELEKVLAAANLLSR